MDLSTLADIAGVAGGVVLLIQVIRILLISSRTGRLAKWRRNRILKRLEKEMGENDFAAWENFQLQLKISQLETGEEAEVLEAILYVDRMNDHPEINEALKNVICRNDITSKCCVEALRVLKEKLIPTHT